jgi:hypothetical protein
MKKIRIIIDDGHDSIPFVIEECEGTAEIRRERGPKIEAGPTASCAFGSIPNPVYLVVKVETIE